MYPQRQPPRRAERDAQRGGNLHRIAVLEARLDKHALQGIRARVESAAGWVCLQCALLAQREIDLRAGPGGGVGEYAGDEGGGDEHDEADCDDDGGELQSH